MRERMRWGRVPEPSTWRRLAPRRALATMRPTGIWGCGWPHPGTRRIRRREDRDPGPPRGERVLGQGRDERRSRVSPGRSPTRASSRPASSARRSGRRRSTCASSTEFERTRQTADVALEGRDVPRLVLPELNDIHVGEFEGGLLETYRAWARDRSPVEIPRRRREPRRGRRALRPRLPAGARAARGDRARRRARAPDPLRPARDRGHRAASRGRERRLRDSLPPDAAPTSSTPSSAWSSGSWTRSGGPSSRTGYRLIAGSARR